MKGKLKVVVLTGQDSPSLCSIVSMLADLPQVEIRGILFGVQPRTSSDKLRDSERTLWRGGLLSTPVRVRDAVGSFLDALARRVVAQDEVLKLLRQSFPGRAFCLADLRAQRDIPVEEVGHLDGVATASALRKLDADLGVALETGILPRPIFSIPRMGCIHLYRGKLPEYPGTPPGFWEIYDGQSSAEVTVHFVDDRWNAGDIVGTESVPIHPKDTPETLRKKLDQCGRQLLARCVGGLAEGSVVRRPPSRSTHKPRNSPTRRQQREIYRKRALPSPARASWRYVLKTLLYVLIFYSGVFHLVRLWRRIRRTSRACVLVYHRVNDLAEDTLTTSVERFAEQMVVVRKYYSVVPTSVLVEKVKSGERLPGHSLLVHFDDCYRDVYTHASRLLAQIGFPACCFVSSGYVGTDRIFPHDVETCPFRMENLTPDDLQGLMETGFQIGSHTVNHADLGQCTYDVAAFEVVQSKQDLEGILGRPVTLFAYPYGGKKNIRPEVVELIRHAGYEALFSAYGGYVNGRADPYNLPRCSVSEQFRPLDLLMEVEGLSLARWKRQWSKA